MIKLKNMKILTTRNYYNLNAYWMIVISLVLCNAHVVLKNQDKIVFYVNNYID